MSESKLEAELYESMRLLSMTEQGFPMPEREYRPFWCCQHPKRAHRWTEWRFYPPARVECWWCHGCNLFWDDAVPNPARHQYRHDRDWRCDFVWPDLRLIVEVEGGVWTQGRHTRGSGYTKDTVKYNAIVNAGWNLQRFTGEQVKSGEALNRIFQVLSEIGARP